MVPIVEHELLTKPEKSYVKYENRKHVSQRNTMVLIVEHELLTKPEKSYVKYENRKHVSHRHHVLLDACAIYCLQVSFSEIWS